MEQPKKKVVLTQTQREFLAMKITKRAETDPEFKMKVDKMISEAKSKLEKSDYLNEAHKNNSEKALKYIAESKKRIVDWDKEVERQKVNSKDDI